MKPTSFMPMLAAAAAVTAWMTDAVAAQVFAYWFDPALAAGISGDIQLRYKTPDSSRAELTVNLDFAGVDMDTIRAFEGNCTSEILEYKWHLHTKWSSNEPSAALAGCSKAKTGNHYDPGFACGPASEYADTPDCKEKRNKSTNAKKDMGNGAKVGEYNCFPRAYAENSDACEQGDFAGKFGGIKLDPDKKMYTIWTDDLFPQAADTQPEWSIVLHGMCGTESPRIACAVVDFVEDTEELEHRDEFDDGENEEDEIKEEDDLLPVEEMEESDEESRSIGHSEVSGAGAGQVSELEDLPEEGGRMPQKLRGDDSEQVDYEPDGEDDIPGEENEESEVEGTEPEDEGDELDDENDQLDEEAEDDIPDEEKEESEVEGAEPEDEGDELEDESDDLDEEDNVQKEEGDAQEDGSDGPGEGGEGQEQNSNEQETGPQERTDKGPGQEGDDLELKAEDPEEEHREPRGHHHQQPIERLVDPEYVIDSPTGDEEVAVEPLCEADSEE